jgi:hypothetical protein
MLNVICLKHGTKYGPEYVNKLYNMIVRNLTLPHNFICFTDNPAELNPNIQIKLLPSAPIHGWWWKPYIFKADHFPIGDINLFFDLDMVIVKNIDHFIDFLPGQFVGLRDVGRILRPNLIKLGSAVLKWPAGQFDDIWTKFEKNLSITQRLHGDQDWIWSLHSNDIKFFPNEWIQSYKWEVRSRSELIGHGPTLMFKDIRNPLVDENTSVLAFHGFPNPHQVMDPIIVDNWR